MLKEKDYISLVMNPSMLHRILLILEIEGLITVGDRLNPSLQNSNLIDEVPKEQETIEDWIDIWRGMFTEKLVPRNLCMGIGNRQACITRMSLFLSKVTDNLDTIFEATELYLQDCISNNRFGKLPQYFILPQVTGKLENADLREGDLYEWVTKVLSGESAKDISTYDA